MKQCVYLLILILIFNPCLSASEIIEETSTQVVVREHPKTGKPYVSIVSDFSAPDPFASYRGSMKRPDYRMLDPKVKSGEIPYDGPYSSSTKIYVFAATLATLGAASGVAVLAAAPAAAATTGAATTGGGAYLTGAGIVTGATAAGTVALTKSDPEKDEFIQVSKSERSQTT